MKIEALLFGGIAVFFGGAAVLYRVWSRDPTGTAVLIIAFLMALAISLFCAVNYRRKGARPQDRTEAEVADAAGPVEFFPAHSYWPVVTALGAALTATGIVYGLWLFLIGFGVLARGVAGMALQYVHHGEGQGS
ncbi:aa3-type cytochrome oxidase subunit IV [Streptomyces beihaiensis]|uniref:Cytochrome c oxidase polypeptide 4 n=1 Tax=Streptomyces beihaiensis TaxID=2984495 RepID=A0ABT3U4C4_9ACTN|nr:cytochrome c oxidase subunit 4 [Streptomyces beihaiensis]MCX3063417.1 cytochrome c oxidase subunit 4 [Streptomyces beihaiensis]